MFGASLGPGWSRSASFECVESVELRSSFFRVSLLLDAATAIRVPLYDSNRSQRFAPICSHFRHGAAGLRKGPKLSHFETVIIRFFSIAYGGYFHSSELRDALRPVPTGLCAISRSKWCTKARSSTLPENGQIVLVRQIPAGRRLSPRRAPRKLPSCGLRDGSGVAGCPRRSRRPARERRTRLGSQGYGPSDRPRVPDGSPDT